MHVSLCTVDSLDRSESDPHADRVNGFPCFARRAAIPEWPGEPAVFQISPSLAQQIQMVLSIEVLRSFFSTPAPCLVLPLVDPASTMPHYISAASESWLCSVSKSLEGLAPADGTRTDEQPSFRTLDRWSDQGTTESIRGHAKSSSVQSRTERLCAASTSADATWHQAKGSVSPMRVAPCDSTVPARLSPVETATSTRSLRYWR